MAEKYPRLEVAHYDHTPGAVGSVMSEPVDKYGFVLARFADERGAVEIKFRDGRLELRATEGVLEIAPAAANTAHVQVRTPFGEVHGAQRAYERKEEDAKRVLDTPEARPDMSRTSEAEEG